MSLEYSATRRTSTADASCSDRGRVAQVLADASIADDQTCRACSRDTSFATAAQADASCRSSTTRRVEISTRRVAHGH